MGVNFSEFFIASGRHLAEMPVATVKVVQPNQKCGLFFIYLDPDPYGQK
jgi:hypothetical protein